MTPPATPGHRRPSLQRVSAVLLVSVALATGCGQQTDREPLPGVSTGNPAAAPVTVGRGTVVSVLTVAGTVLATPEYVVTARSRAILHHRAGLQPGQRIKAGDTLGWQDGRPVTAPVDGAFVRWLVFHRMRVVSGAPIAVLRYGGYGIEAEVPATRAYRLYAGPRTARAQVTGGPGPTTCRVVPHVAVGRSTTSGAGRQAAPQDDEAGAADGATGERPYPVLCLLPERARVLAGLPALVGLNTGERKNVLTLPVTAVAGQADKGMVTRGVGDRLVETPVVLGLSDGVQVEIEKGLKEGDQVLPDGPNLRVSAR